MCDTFQSQEDRLMKVCSNGLTNQSYMVFWAQDTANPGQLIACNAFSRQKLVWRLVHSMNTTMLNINDILYKCLPILFRYSVWWQCLKNGAVVLPQCRNSDTGVVCVKEIFTELEDFLGVLKFWVITLQQRSWSKISIIILTTFLIIIDLI